MNHSIKNAQHSAVIQSQENELIKICLKIGSVAEKNSQFTHGLSTSLSKTSTDLYAMSVGEFVGKIDRHTARFNSVFGGES